jgi:hypothetical protein
LAQSVCYCLLDTTGMYHLKIIPVVTQYYKCAWCFKYSDVTEMLWRKNYITRECTINW